LQSTGAALAPIPRRWRRAGASCALRPSHRRVTIRVCRSSASIDDKIIAALRDLHGRFDAGFRSSIDGIDAWVRHNDADASVVALLEHDPVVADQLAIPGHLFLMTAHGGVEYKLHDCVVGGCPSVVEFR
jgi:hypothetical protein